jgi:O-acetyl-ADP-ribose deacetylase (regulator of RNase III)
MPLKVVQQDITKMDVDAIVNAANTALRMGGGVCGAIFRAAGAGQLQAACDQLAPIRTGEAAVTPGFNLKAKYVIHAAGPVYSDYDAKESERLLRSAYASALRLAAERGCRSVAFPLISSGIYGYPKEEALRVAVSAIGDFIRERDMDVYLTLVDAEAIAAAEKLLGEAGE